MEMATQAKTKTNNTKAARETEASAKVKVKAATGNGNPYTQNISTVKERKQPTAATTTFNCFKTISKRRAKTKPTNCRKIQNNKTEIKISRNKQRNYLKFLIKNLYLKLKLILCISQINKTLIKLHKTNNKITNNNYNYNKNTKLENCIINLPQKQQQQKDEKENQQLLITSFKTFTFNKFNKKLLKFLTKFNYYCRPQTNKLEKYVKILLKHIIILILHNKLIKKHFVGICPKRLISLKRLQQIPENHDKLDAQVEETLTTTKIYSKLKENSRKYVGFKENLRKVIKFPQKLKGKWKEYNLKESNGSLSKSIRYKRKNVQLKYCQLFAKDTNNKMYCQLRLCKETHTSLVLAELKTPQNPYRKERPISQDQDLNRRFEKSPLGKQIENSEQQISEKLSSGKLQRVPRTFQTKEYKIELIPVNIRNTVTINETLEHLIRFSKSPKVSEFSEHQENLRRFAPTSLKVAEYSQLKAHSKALKPNPNLGLLRNENQTQDLKMKKESSNSQRVSQTPQRKAYNIESVPVIWNVDEINKITRDLCKSANSSKSPEYSPKQISPQIEKELCSSNSQRVSQTSQRKTYNTESVPELWNIEEFIKLTELLSRTSNSSNSLEYSPQQIVPQTSQMKEIWDIEEITVSEYSPKHELLPENKTMLDLQECKENSEEICNSLIPHYNSQMSNQFTERRVAPKQHLSKINSMLFSQNKNCQPELQENFENPEEKRPTVLELSDQPKNSDEIRDPLTIYHQNSLQNGDLLTATKIKVFNQKLADNTNFAKEILSHNNNNISYKNSRHKESKQQKFLKKCQHFLSSILLYYCCCCSSSCYCIWHIYGYPLVLVKIFKYLKDSTVHVLTQRLKIATTTTTIATKAAVAATSIVYNYSNIIAACFGKLKKPTKMADYNANDNNNDSSSNQQNILKRQTTHKTAATTKFVGTCAYSSSSCSTTSLTGSSAYSSSPENLVQQQQQQRQQQQPQQTWTPYCHYQEPHLHQRHHQRQNRQQQQQHLLRCYQTPSTLPPHLQSSQPQYSNSSKSSSLPSPSSLLVFSRTLIILILLSSLWHTSEGFHGSGVKLSTNTVKTKYGLVRGIVVRSAPSLVEAYLGIPYASPPVGSLRFMPPITPSTWKNVRNADRFSPVCPQNVPIPPNGPEALLEVPRARLAQLRRLLPLLSNQSEDCLYLNIYVPYEHRRHRRFTTNSGELNDTPKLPIILFIHGESYEWNSGNPYDGSELAAHGNVIVVTINFRLGIFGFLKTGGKESAQGNFGLMDLVAGLHWLRENLPAFGGDPQAITLLGHGTGAALANILVVSPVASDLIQHTVMVSGSALSPWAIQKNPLFVKRRVAEQTGCHGDMLYYDLAPCLRTKTVAELLAVKIDHPRFLVGFAPFIDGTVISPNTDSIGKLSLPLGSAIVSTSGIEYANFPKRNLIFCLTSVESHLDLSAQDLEFGFNETRRDRILRTYVRNNFHYHLNEIFAVLKNEYTDWDKAIRSPLSSRDATLQFLSDGHTASSLIKLGYMHSLRGGRGYFLHFKHRTVEEEYPQRTGSVRGEDVPFWLGLPISPLFPHNYTTQEKQISRLMLRYLANFAKTGNPNQSSPSSGQPSSSSLIGSPPSASSSSSTSSSSSSASSSSSQTADDSHEKVKRSSLNIVNATSSSSSSSASSSSGPIKSNAIAIDVETAAAREALNLAVLYNQRRTKRTYYKRHSRSNDDHSGSASSEVNYFLSLNNNNNNNKLDGDELPFWDAYDVVNQLYMELGNKAEIQSHYRGHKLSMWLNLIPQLHRHANMNDQSMRHHQFQDDLNNLNLYEGIVRAQIQTKPDDDDETILLPKGRPTPPPAVQETNTTQKPIGGTTECGVDGAMFVAEMTTVPPSDNRSLVLDSREKEMATASTGLIGNLEVLRRLSGKQFQSYTTALVATVAVGCFLLILNILIFAGIYHQREKRARDAKTKEELQDNDTSKNSSMLKLNALGSETGSFNGSGAGVCGKTTVVFGEYSCYDEKSLQTKDEKLIVELPPPQMMDPNWAACSTSTLDLLKTKHHTPLDNTYTLGNVVPINTESQTDHLIAVNAMEMATYNPLPMTSGLIIDPTLATTATSSSGLLSKRGSFVGSAGQLNQYDFASVQSSDQMSFKDIENAVKASATMDDDITHDDDIPEPPPPPRSFHNMQQQQQQQLQQGTANAPASASGSGVAGGILRQAGTTSATQTGGGKKRVHIQEISV